MRIPDWMRAGAILLHLVATAWVLSQCDRLMKPADQTKAHPKAASHAMPAKEQGGQDDAKTGMSEQAKLRAEKRKKHEDALAQHRAQYLALEADLAAMIQTDIPAALGELANAAQRYRNKLSDLKQLKKTDQWARETPVKDALARARGLTEEWYRIDFEAQKHREGPTLHSPPDIEGLTKRLAAFKRAGEEIESFAAALAPLHGKVPEVLMLSAIDAIPRAVLPKDAFDPCRDPAACPKPAVVQPLEPLKPTYCIAHSSDRRVALLARPELAAFVTKGLAPGQCGIMPTGRKAASNGTYGYARFIEVEVEGRTGWIGEGSITIPSGAVEHLAAPSTLRDQRYCVDGSREPLPLRDRPSTRAPAIVHVLPTSCKLTGTGREAADGRWIEVTHEWGYTGWLQAHNLRPR